MYGGKGLLQNRILKNRSKKKLARIVKTAILANFFNAQIPTQVWKLYFATDPLIAIEVSIVNDYISKLGGID